MKKTRFMTQAAIIAALYAVLTILIPGGSGAIQVRVAEALTVLPFLTPAAIPGLFIGCIVANIFVGNGPMDIIFGSLATLAAAFFTHKMPRSYLAPIPPIVINAVVVAVMLNYVIQAPLLATMGFVALGEAIACYALGYPLLLTFERYRDRIFK